MDANTEKQIKKINELSEGYYEKLVAMNEELDDYMLTTKEDTSFEFNTRLKSAAYNKKAKDANIALKVIYKDIDYSDTEAPVTFHKNSEYYDDGTPFPSVIAPGGTLEYIYKFKNKGMFYAWGKKNDLGTGYENDKKINLKIDIHRNDAQVEIDPMYVELIVSEGTNPPGDEKTNGDYDKIKSFDVSIGSSSPTIAYTWEVGNYTLSFSIVNEITPSTTPATYSAPYNCIHTENIVVKNSETE